MGQVFPETSLVWSHLSPWKNVFAEYKGPSSSVSAVVLTRGLCIDFGVVLYMGKTFAPAAQDYFSETILAGWLASSPGLRHTKRGTRVSTLAFPLPRELGPTAELLGPEPLANEMGERKFASCVVWGPL